MSCYQVSNEQIDAVVSVWIALGRPGRTPGHMRLGEAQAIGAMLVRENARSVAHRYPDHRPAEQIGAEIDALTACYQFKRDPFVSVVNVSRCIAIALKLIANYEYQACEHPGWEASDACKFCSRLRDELIESLPGYAAAPWGCEDRNVFASAVQS